jgi:hypothetical protein
MASGYAMPVTDEPPARVIPLDEDLPFDKPT